MAHAILLDVDQIERLVAERRASGGDRYDEVWDGVYVMSPLATNEHQRIATALCRAFLELAPPGTTVLAGANVSDRRVGWEHQYRCPDVVVVLPGGRAQDRGTHFEGGPDLLVEVVSRNDRSRDKIAFYALIGVREVLLIDPETRSIELHRLRDSSIVPVGVSTPAAPVRLELETLIVVVTSSATAPHIIVSDRAGGRQFPL